jgi:ribosomal protein S18 acetylase RimI-like enzyme
MVTGSSIRKATPADAPRLAHALASAFQDDPIIAWVFPDERRRKALLSAFMDFRLRKLGFPHDEIWMTRDGAAVAVWIPPGGWLMSISEQVRLLPPIIRFFGLRTPTVLRGLEIMERRHPHHPPHWYLFILGTERSAQGRGLGSALLGHMLERIDASELPVYLESSKERNVALYARHGFEVVGEAAIPSGPKIWLMWRRASPRPSPPSG